MVDRISPAQRSANMARILNKDSVPEMLVRRFVHSLGYRYRLHSPKLPGHPDLVLSGLRKVVFVHGCFWHRHPGCALAAVPKTRVEFWKKKFDRNIERDRRVLKELRKSGWAVLVVWECETRVPTKLERKIIRFLEKE